MKHLAAAVVATLIFAPVAQPDPLQSFKEEHRAGLVYIESSHVLPNGAPYAETGTGFVISDGRYVLTCAHVLADTNRPDGTTEHWGIIGATQGQRYSLELISRDTNLDLALLQFRSDGARVKPLRLARSTTMQGKGVAALGFFDDILHHARGEITSVAGPRGSWITAAPFNPGFSGGPIIRSDGKVVAIARGSHAQGDAHRYVIPVAHATALLQIASVTVDEDDPPATGSNVIPVRSDFGDMPVEGDCESRRSQFEKLGQGIKWKCGDAQVPATGRQGRWINAVASVVVPLDAAILDVRYFHRSRGDWQAPVEYGPWHRNAPGADLQWMNMERATAGISNGTRSVSAVCNNQSHVLSMSCAIGVQFKETIKLW